VINTRIEEDTVFDVELGGSMISGGSRSGGERSDPERREPPTPPVGAVPLMGTERPEPEVPAKAQKKILSTIQKEDP